EMVAGANVAAAAFARRWLVAGLTPGTAYGIAGQRAGPRSPGSRLYRGDDGQSWVRDQCRFALVPSVIQADGGRQRMDDSQSRPRSRRLVLLRQCGTGLRAVWPLVYVGIGAPSLSLAGRSVAAAIR